MLSTAEVVHRFPTSSSVHNLSSTEPSVTQHLLTRSALLLAVGTFVALSFEAMPGLCCFLRVTLANSKVRFDHRAVRHKFGCLQAVRYPETSSLRFKFPFLFRSEQAPSCIRQTSSSHARVCHKPRPTTSARQARSASSWCVSLPRPPITAYIPTVMAATECHCVRVLTYQSLGSFSRGHGGIPEPSESTERQRTRWMVKEIPRCPCGRNRSW